MTRFMTGVALGAFLIGSTVAMASTPTANPMHHSSRYSQHCSSLASQWQTASEGRHMSRHFGKAKVDAARGERLCSSSNVSHQRRGVADYRAALKLIGVRPT